MSALCAQIHEMCQFIEWNFISSTSTSSSFHAYVATDTQCDAMGKCCEKYIPTSSRSFCVCVFTVHMNFHIGP